MSRDVCARTRATKIADKARFSKTSGQSAGALADDDSLGGADARRNHGEDINDAGVEDRGSVHADDDEAGG